MQVLTIDKMEMPKVTALIYGAPGVGKTTMLGYLPGKTLILDVDRGTISLKGCANAKNISVVRVGGDLKELRDTLDDLQKKCEYDNVCIDTITEIEKGMLTAYGRAGKNDGVPEMGHYQKMQFKLRDYVRSYRALPANLILTAWEVFDEIIDPSGEKYTRARPSISNKVVDEIMGNCDIVGRLSVSDDNETKGRRFIQLASSNSAIAKDRISKRKACWAEELIPNGR